MSADVLSLDGARVSAREWFEVDADPDAAVFVERSFEALERLQRQVSREARRVFGPAPIERRVYITYEEYVAAPDLDPVA